MANGLKLSFLWIFVLFNMAFADIVGFIVPGTLEDIMMGETGFEITQTLLLVFAILLEIPILMAVLNMWIAAPKMRLPNVVAVLITAVFVIGGGSATLPYMFFATCELLAMGLILRLSFER